MTTYHYKDSSLIDSVVVEPLHTGFSTAVILFKDNTDPAQIEDLRKQLGEREFLTLIDTLDGKPALQVRGVQNAEKLLSASDKLSLTSNNVEKLGTSAPEKENVKKKGFRERVRNRSFLLSALFYDLGNIAFIVSGIQRGKHNPGGKFTPSDISEMAIGGAFSVGDILMTKYGKDDGSEELQAAAEGLEKHLKQKGIKIPEGDLLNPDTLHKSGAMEEVDRWLHKNIIYVKCLAEFAGGLFTMGSALKPGNRNNRKLAAGMLHATAWMATCLLEKPRGHKIFNVDVENPSLIDKIKQNPRGWLARPASMTNNVLNISGALGERKRWQNDPLRKNDYIYNVFSASSFLVANTLFGISGSKRPQYTEDDKKIEQDLILIAANLLAKQPEIGKAAIDETAEYLSAKLAHVQMSKDEVTKALNDKIAALSKNAWVSRIQSPPPSEITV